MEVSEQLLNVSTERVVTLEEEHGTGTRTTRRSRNDLVQIAGMIGMHATWRRTA